MAELDGSAVEKIHDYSIEGIRAEVASHDANFTRDFAMEGFALALDADYSSDSASSRLFLGSAGVATSFVY